MQYVGGPSVESGKRADNKFGMLGFCVCDLYFFFSPFQRNTVETRRGKISWTRCSAIWKRKVSIQLVAVIAKLAGEGYLPDIAVYLLFG